MKIKNEDLIGISFVLNQLKDKPTPIKFCVARNISKIEKELTIYTEAKDKLYKDAVKMDEEGPIGRRS